MIQSLLVFFAVSLQVLSALITDYASSLSQSLNLLVILLLGLALLVNIIKFLAWGKIHKRFDLSKSYPMTAVFFPLIYAIAIIKGEAEIEILKLAGIIFIIIGVVAMQKYPTKKHNL